MTRFNSLLGPNKFPVPMRRELARKSLNLALDSEPTIHSGAPANKIPCIFPASREFGFRDEFAQDCLLQRGVACEPEDDIDIPVRRGSTITIRSRSTTSRRDSRVAERLSRMPYRPRAGGFSGP